MSHQATTLAVRYVAGTSIKASGHSTPTTLERFMPDIPPPPFSSGSAHHRRERYRGALLGLAVGDALGTTLEFCPRDYYPTHTEMLGGGAFDVAPGEWTDDTAMALCLAASLIECRDFDHRDQLQRYHHWWKEGYMSCQGRCIDIGNTTLTALMRYLADMDYMFAETRDDRFSGNGGIMRLAPAVMAANSMNMALDFAVESSLTTHASPDCFDAAALMGSVLWRLLQGEALTDVLSSLDPVSEKGIGIQRIIGGDFRSMSRHHVSSSGYVIDTLEAALWCCWQANSLEEALILAANLGDDADTVAAVTGQLAGAAWGEESIPKRWLEPLAWCEEIRAKADNLYELARNGLIWMPA